MGEIVVAALVDGDAEAGQAEGAGFLDGAAGVFDPVAAFVAVEVVGLAVGEDQQETASARLRGEQASRIADGGAHAGVIAGLDGGDAPAHAGAVRLLEVLQTVNAHRVATTRRETEHAEAIAGRGQALGEEKETIADDIDDACAVVDPGVGRERQIREQQTHQIARPFAHVAIESVAVGADARGAGPGMAIGGETQIGVQIDLLSVGLAALPHPRRGEGLELVAQPLGRAAQVLGQLAGCGVRGDQRDHATLIRAQRALSPVPLGQEDPLREDEVVLGLGRQIQIELQTRAGCLTVARDRDAIQIGRGGAGALEIVLLVGPAVDLDMLAPGQDVLHPDRHQTLILLRHGDPLGTPSTALAERLDGGIAIDVLRLAAEGVRPRVRPSAGRELGIGVEPEHDRIGWTARRREPRNTAGVLQRKPDGLLAHTLVRRQGARIRAQVEMGIEQSPVARTQARKTHERPAGLVLAFEEPISGRAGLLGRERGEPDVEITIQRTLREEVDPGGQTQRTLVAPGQLDLLVKPGEALKEPATGAVSTRLGRFDLESAIAAERTEEDADGDRNLFERHRRKAVAPLRETGDGAMPECSDVFFHIGGQRLRERRSSRKGARDATVFMRFEPSHRLSARSKTDPSSRSACLGVCRACDVARKAGRIPDSAYSGDR